MTLRTHALPRVMAAGLALSLGACSDSIGSPSPEGPQSESSVSWNQVARDLMTARAVSNPAVQARILAYLSVAQYNVIDSAEDAGAGRDNASPAAAAAGASLVVLKSFFPLESAECGRRIVQATCYRGFA